MLKNLFQTSQKVQRGVEDDSPSPMKGPAPRFFSELDELIKIKQIDMREITGRIDASSSFSGTFANNRGMITITLDANVYTGLLITCYWTVSGAPTSYDIRQPFEQIQYEIKNKNGGNTTITFPAEYISAFQAYMLKSMSYKHIFDRNYTFKRGATATEFRQYIFLPTPSSLMDSPINDSSSKIFPVNPTRVNLKLTFYGSTDKFFVPTGGTNPSIEFSQIPELRYTAIASERSKKFFYNYFARHEVPVWDFIRLEPIRFTPTGTSYGEVETNSIPTFIDIVAVIGWMYDEDVDEAHFDPIPLITDNEAGIYKSSTNVVTATSDAMQLKMAQAFDTLPYDGQKEDVEPFIIPVTNVNMFDITAAANGMYLSTGNATDYKVKIRSIESGLTGGDLHVIDVDLATIVWINYN